MWDLIKAAAVALLGDLGLLTIFSHFFTGLRSEGGKSKKDKAEDVGGYTRELADEAASTEDLAGLRQVECDKWTEFMADEQLFGPKGIDTPEKRQFRGVWLNMPQEMRAPAKKAFITLPVEVRKLFVTTHGLNRISGSVRAQRELMKLIKQGAEWYRTADQQAADNIGNAGSTLDGCSAELLRRIEAKGSPKLTALARLIAGRPEDGSDYSI